MSSRIEALEKLYRSAESVDEILATARSAARTALLEVEGLAIARLLGFAVPEMRVVHGSDEVRSGSRDDLPGRFAPERRRTPARGGGSTDLVLKAIAADLIHKSEAGAVVRVEREPQAVADAIESMAMRLVDVPVEGFSICPWIEHAQDLAGELIVGFRRTPDFGPVISVGPGGVFTEHVTRAMLPERGLALFSAHEDAAAVADRLRRLAIVPMLTGELRGQPRRLALDRLVEMVLALGRLATRVPELAELELNPVIVKDGELMALDAVARLEQPAHPRLERPAAKLHHLLEPRSIAVVGVSARGRNPGRIIAENVLAAGFPRECLWIVKPRIVKPGNVEAGMEAFDGCRRVTDLDSLEPVDLLVLAVAADQAAGLLEEAVRRRLAESVILIPGGVGEVAGSEAVAARVRRALDESRRSPGGGPVLCGGNCLGARSRPGRFDTLFIPRYKLGLGREGDLEDRAALESRVAGGVGEPAADGRLALVSQSGAFALARASQLAGQLTGELDRLDPRYIITLGNQLDLTIGDAVDYLAQEPGTRVVACYVEGFAEGDGEHFLRAAGRCRRAGRPVILYRAGRTPAGASKAASHTASMAGDYTVTRELAGAAGVVVAETLEDFDDLVSIFTLLHDRPASGQRLGALSNAGFECVAMADQLAGLELASFCETTRGRLGQLLEASRLGAIVGVSNPLDTTPILGDESFAAASRLVLEDRGVDVGLVGCVPMTGALETLEKAESSGGEDVERPGAIADRLARLHAETSKPWAAVVDGGPLYDALARRLRRAGIPTFRRADRAVRALDVFCRWHALARAGTQEGSSRPA